MVHTWGFLRAGADNPVSPPKCCNHNCESYFIGDDGCCSQSGKNCIESTVDSEQISKNMSIVGSLCCIERPVDTNILLRNLRRSRHRHEREERERARREEAEKLAESANLPWRGAHSNITARLPQSTESELDSEDKELSITASELSAMPRITKRWGATEKRCSDKVPEQGFQGHSTKR